MAPQKQGCSGGGQLLGSGSGSGGRPTGVQPSSATAAAKKSDVQLLQADHELFLQAFESESHVPGLVRVWWRTRPVHLIWSLSAVPLRPGPWLRGSSSSRCLVVSLIHEFHHECSNE